MVITLLDDGTQRENCRNHNPAHNLRRCYAWRVRNPDRYRANQRELMARRRAAAREQSEEE